MTSAYGFAIEGLTDGPAQAELPVVRLARRVAEPGAAPPHFTDRGCEAAFGEGRRMVVDRASRQATLIHPEPVGDDELLHPFLTRACSVFAHWQGYETLHCGAFIHGG